jgi:hypothetical protein
MESVALAVSSSEPNAGIIALCQMVLKAVVSPHRRGSKAKSIWTTEGLREKCPLNRFEMGQNDGFLVWETAQPGTTGSLALEWMQKRWRAEATSGIFACSREAKWKFRLN